ncbi:hypothetical protein COD11_15530 [Bacillus sp. AFS040349]|nr:hypothetical protein COD11_15530 [Bacillus sp. AFS040349]
MSNILLIGSSLMFVVGMVILILGCFRSVRVGTVPSEDAIILKKYGRLALVFILLGLIPLIY